MNSVAAKLSSDHRELDVLLRRLAQDAAAPLAGALQGTWESFETKLLRHMDAEERYLLPLLEASDPQEVARIRFDHKKIRNLLAELGMAVELHTAREPRITELIGLLRAHAKHEDAALYRLAGEKASSSIEQAIFHVLKQGVPSTPRKQVEHQPIRDER